MKKSATLNTRTASKEDFKVGTTLIIEGGFSFTIKGHYSDSMWNARGTEGQGEIVVNEGNAKFYQVEI